MKKTTDVRHKHQVNEKSVTRLVNKFLEVIKEPTLTDSASTIASQLITSPSAYLVDLLSALIEADFDDKPTYWINHLGRKVEVVRSALNLCTTRQRWVMYVLSRMSCPNATRALDQLTPPGMMLIPSGYFQMGSNVYRDEEPLQKLWLEAFWIDRYPVTNAQWAAFIEEGGYQKENLWVEAGRRWKRSKPPHPDEWEAHKIDPDHPVRGICWYEALAYSRWARKHLLSEAHWEKAAKGTDRRKYPWGDEFDIAKCNTAEAGFDTTTSVGHFSPAGDSPYGVADMAGNVREWCIDLYSRYPYNVNKAQSLDVDGDRVMRGGAFDHAKWYARVSCRTRLHPHRRRRFRGARVGLVVRIPKEQCLVQSES